MHTLYKCRLQFWVRIQPLAFLQGLGKTQDREKGKLGRLQDTELKVLLLEFSVT